MDKDNNMNDVWYIKFYAPWWGHWKKLAPIWEDLADYLSKDGDINVGSVDCTEQPIACERVEVSGYPTIYVFDRGVAYHFEGMRTYENLRAFVNYGSYLQHGKVTVIQKDSEIPKTMIGKFYLEVTKGLATIFKAIKLDFIPPIVQLFIAIFICCIPFALIIYAICYPDEEYELLQKQIEEKEKEKEELLKKKQTDTKKND